MFPKLVHYSRETVEGFILVGLLILFHFVLRGFCPLFGFFFGGFGLRAPHHQPCLLVFCGFVRLLLCFVLGACFSCALWESLLQRAKAKNIRRERGEIVLSFPPERITQTPPLLQNKRREGNKEHLKQLLLSSSAVLEALQAVDSFTASSCQRVVSVSCLQQLLSWGPESAVATKLCLWGGGGGEGCSVLVWHWQRLVFLDSICLGPSRPTPPPTKQEPKEQKWRDKS